MGLGERVIEGKSFIELSDCPVFISHIEEKNPQPVDSLDELRMEIYRTPVSFSGPVRLFHRFTDLTEEKVGRGILRGDFQETVEGSDGVSVTFCLIVEATQVDIRYWELSVNGECTPIRCLRLVSLPQPLVDESKVILEDRILRVESKSLLIFRKGIIILPCDGIGATKIIILDGFIRVEDDRTFIIGNGAVGNTGLFVEYAEIIERHDVR